MKYLLTIETENEPNPGTPNHWESLLFNINNRNLIKVTNVEELDD